MRRLLFAAPAAALLATMPLAHASFINYSSREINVKIVYYGPGTNLAENLQYIYEKTNPEAKGKLIKLATETESTLFFDFLPLSLGEIRGFKTRFHLYTVPGKIEYEASRQLILKGVDGVVFVADADPKMARENVRALMSLRTNLAKLDYDYDSMPIVFQIAGTGAKGALTKDAVAKTLFVGDRPVFEANVVEGAGVFDSLKGIAKLVLMELKKGAESADPSPIAP